MATTTPAIPRGAHSVTAYLCMRDAAQAIDFYKQAFGAKEIMRMAMPDGKIGHAELEIGDSRLMLCDEFPEMGNISSQQLKASPVMLHLYVEDVDQVFKRAVQAGAQQEREVADQFYGDRGGKLKDPFGHLWWIATHKEDVAPDELKRRHQAMFTEKKGRPAA